MAFLWCILFVSHKSLNVAKNSSIDIGLQKLKKCASFACEPSWRAWPCYSKLTCCGGESNLQAGMSNIRPQGMMFFEGLNSWETWFQFFCLLLFVFWSCVTAATPSRTMRKTLLDATGRFMTGLLLVFPSRFSTYLDIFQCFFWSSFCLITLFPCIFAVLLIFWYCSWWGQRRFQKG